MTVHAQRFPAVLLSTLASLLAQGPARPAQEGADRPFGLVVEDVEEGFAGYRAGLQPGDVLLHWRRSPSPPADPERATGELVSPFDLEEAEIEQAPRGELTLLGMRGGQPLEVRVPTGEWKIRTRPPLEIAEGLDLYEQARALIGEEETDEGLALWGGLASSLAESGDSERASWLYLRIAMAASRSRWEIAEDALDEALRLAQAGGRAAASAAITDFWGSALQGRSELDRAAVKLRQSLDVRRARSPTSLGIARSLHDLGALAWRRGDLEAAEDHHRRSLAIREELAPDSMPVASSLNNLGLVALSRGDLPTAESYHLRSLAIGEALAPKSIGVASSLNNLGLVALSRGDLPTAESYHLRSLAIGEALAPKSIGVASSLNNLGEIARLGGDLVAAEEHLRRSFAIQEKLAPESLDLALSLNNLGNLAFDGSSF